MRPVNFKIESPTLAKNVDHLIQHDIDSKLGINIESLFLNTFARVKEQGDEIVIKKSQWNRVKHHAMQAYKYFHKSLRPLLNLLSPSENFSLKLERFTISELKEELKNKFPNLKFLEANPSNISFVTDLEYLKTVVALVLKNTASKDNLSLELVPSNSNKDNEINDLKLIFRGKGLPFNLLSNLSDFKAFDKLAVLGIKVDCDEQSLDFGGTSDRLTLAMPNFYRDLS